MNSPLSFDSFVGNARVVEILRRSVEQGRLPHALIFAGPPSIGKRSLALLLAQLLNCFSPKRGTPCGECASCRKILSGSHPDVREIQPDGAYIKIEQVRSLIGEIAYQPFEARYRVVILDSADQMRQEAANCLLKTLEEPASPTIIILVTPKPYLLLGTIQSRCRLLKFGGVAQDQIEEYLMKSRDLPAEEARLAALCSKGSLGGALSFNAAEFRALRARAMRFLSLLLVQRNFAEFAQVAAEASKEKDAFPNWIEAVEALLQDVYYARTAPARMAQPDISEEIRGMARAAAHSEVLWAIKSIQRLRFAVERNANKLIALEAIYLSKPS